MRLPLPSVDGGCFEVFSRRTPRRGLFPSITPPGLVLDGAPSHRSEEIGRPENVMSLLRLPAYSPELNPVERWFQEEFRRALSNRTFETVEHLQEALTRALAPYWEEPARLERLTGFSWWVEAVDAL